MNIHDAFHRTVHGAPGGCESLAVRLGMSPVILRNKANPNSTTNKPMLDDVDRVMGLTGDYQLLHALAQVHGFVCVPINPETNPDGMALIRLIGAVWQTEGEVGAELNAALEDGRVTKAELAQVTCAVKRCERALEGVVAALSKMAAQ